MKKLLGVLILGFAFHLSVIAQPTLTVTDASPSVNEQDFCVDVLVRDFSFLLSMEFSVTWDETVIDFENVTNFNPAVTNLGPGSFNLTQTADGILIFNWETPGPDCSQNGSSPITLVPNNEDQVLFSICFDAVGEYGDATDVAIGSDPVPLVVTRQFTPTPSCNNIGAFLDDGLVSLGVRPLTIYAANEFVNTGDQVCVDFNVVGFDELTSVQFTVEWDATNLEYVEVQVGDITNTSPSGTFAHPADSVVTVSWSYVVPGGDGISVPDSTLFFTLCYDVIGDCEEATDINLVGEPTSIEVINTVQLGADLTFVGIPGSVTTGDCIPTGLQLEVDCPNNPINLNDNYCVPIRAGSNFQNVTDLAFLFNFNENILEYTGINNINLPNFNVGNNVNDDNAAGGILSFDWENGPLPAVTLANNAVLFEVCFDVVGLGGNSPLIIPASPSIARINNGSNIGVSPSNCVFQVLQPAGVTLDIPGANVPLGGQTCLDLTVSNFVDVETMQFSLNWDTDQIDFVSIQSVNLPGATIMDNFVTALAPAGALTFDWDAASAVTLNDGDVIMTICFEAVGDPNTCSQVELADFPISSEVTTSDSNGNNIGITGQSGDFCILNPDGFYLVMPEESGIRGDTLCVPVKVADFDDITTANFDILFNPILLEFVELGTTFDIPGLDAADIDVSNANLGFLRIEWMDAAGITVPDSTIMLEMCFALNDDRPYECSPLRTNNEFVEVLTGAGSLIPIDGEICIEDKLEVTDVVIQGVTCPGDADGTIEITVEGGLGNIVYNWQSTPVQFTNRATNLPTGPIEVIFFDVDNPALSDTLVFDIPAGEAPMVMVAQEEIVASCDPPLTLVSATTSASQGTLECVWRSIGGTVFGTGDNALIPAPGSYYIECEIIESGCTARDTVVITPPVLPTADAGEDVPISCDSPTLTLDGSGSSATGTSLLWTVVSGDVVITPGEETAIMPTVTSTMGGVVELTVTINATGCTATDQVEILTQGGFPNANAGDDKIIGCSGTVILDGSNSFNQFPVDYVWTDIDGNVLINDITYEANLPGEYVLVVTNLTTQCVTTDTAAVTQNADFPVVAISRDTSFNCVTDTVTLDLQISNAANYDFEWSSPDGGTFVFGTNNTETPQVLVPNATYEVTVTNIFNNCETIESITVPIDTIAPTVIPSTEDTLLVNCAIPEYTLDGDGSSAGAAFTYTWSNQFGVISTPGDTLDVSDAGYYYLEIENTLNGCTAMDSVYVDTTFLSPNLTANDPPALSCSIDSIVLVATPEVGSVDPDSITVLWTPVGNMNMIENADQLEAIVRDAGTYQVEVTVNASGCSETLELTVVQDDLVPEAIINSDETELTCNLEDIALDGSASSSGTRYVYEWVATGGGFVPPADINNANITIEFPGTYQLIVTDTLFDCTASEVVQITENVEDPVVSIGADTILTCLYNAHQFNTALSDQGPEYTYAWFKDGDMTPVSTEIDFMATEAGEYVLVVTDTTNGCESLDIAFLTDLQEDPPMVTFEQSATLSCLVDQTTISAVPTPDQNYEYQWFVINDMGTPEMLMGETDSTLVLTAGGDYQVQVIDPISECNAMVDIEVVQDTVAPTAMIMTDTVFRTCEVPTATLSGTGSSGGPIFTYEWKQIDPFPIDGLSDAIQYQTDQPGIYIFEVINTFNGCTATDTVELVENFVLPELTIAEPDTFRCNTATVQLDATASQIPGDYESLWISFGAGNVDTLMGFNLIAQADSAGTYQLTVITNPDIEECFTFTTIEIPGDYEAPEIIAAEPDTFTCFTSEIILDATQSDNNGNLTSQWNTIDGGTILPNDLEASVDAPGTYQFLLSSNPLVTACTAVDTFEVLANPETPELTFNAVDTITCDFGGPIILDATPSGINEDLLASVQWLPIEDGGPVSPVTGAGPLVVQVNAAGTYELSISINNALGDCDAMGTIVVEADTVAPQVTLATPSELTCIEDIVNLDASDSQADGPLTFLWEGIQDNDDAFVDGINDQAIVEVLEGGNYRVTVENTENGCEVIQVLEVDENTTPPTPALSDPEAVGCDGEPVSLDATLSGDAGLFSSVTWTGVDVADPMPNNTLITETALAGTYELTLVLASNGCDSTITITVDEDTDVPVAEAGPQEQNIGCGPDGTTLDASASSQGPEFSYQWTVLDGTATLSNPTDLTTDIDGEGTFVLEVLNSDNSCTSTDTVFVTLQVDLPLADLEADFGICEDSLMLFAEIPAGATGIWRDQNNNVVFDDPESGTTFASNLISGDNIFTFTLSAENCEDYSSDTLVVSVADVPNANNDLVQLELEQEVINFNVVNNDIITGGGFTLRLLTQPTFGTLEFDEVTGEATYTIKLGQFGDTEFSYEVCSDICPDLCDEAVVQIEVPETEVAFEIPNGITMNDDGVNDAFVFDQLLLNPDLYPDNELIIFNRWGDVVFQAKPYLNDWTGVNENGEQLPEGTYYYILRLDISKGEIIRGDVTIVK